MFQLVGAGNRGKRMNEYQKFIHKSRYARYLDKEGRRETWEETVDRYCNFWDKPLPDEVKQAILDMEIMPSMRALMTAGPALSRDNMAGYNCSFIAVDHVRAFDENLYVLLCGTGVGFSVERQFISKLPDVADSFNSTETTVVVRDSKIGWASALRELISLLYQGRIPEIDYSRIRPAGARLKTFGGRASGPEPLKKLFNQYIRIFKGASGRRLNSIECHDLLCFNGEAVVVGGVRRAAELSLSNLTDERMQRAKMGQWWIDEPQRALSNNSVCYTEKPDIGIFMREWISLYESKSGERGIFNRQAAKDLAPDRRDTDHDFGCNPCSEVILRSSGLCNLSEVVLRVGDKFEDVKRKVRLATILGTYQSTLTDFRYVRPIWKRNAEEERLLGVSFTGVFDCPEILHATPEELMSLRDHAVEQNKIWAKKLKINQSVAVTCIKPSGTVSQLVGVSGSGLHPAYAQYYIRRVRQDIKDPLNQALIESGKPYITDPYNKDAIVFEFPMGASTKSITRNQISALEHLEIWKKFALYWCEHKPSVTIYVGEDEWLSVGAWCWDNFDIISGVSFLPKADDAHIYEAAPYEEVTTDVWGELYEKTKSPIDWDNISEEDDYTIGSQELACTADACEI
jgi:ribonucleoside-triphosphate reductase|tara:strand:- start:2016 stop:3899 length:1884 start_codon:yes stop_codon:yes gene_type:complete